MGILLVYSRPVSGEREDEYNRWYDEVHLKEVCALDPFVGGQRFKASETQMMGDPGIAYVAIYEFNGHPQAALDALTAGAATFTMSDALDTATAKVVVLEEHAARFVA